jgi:hypothetical protein
VGTDTSSELDKPRLALRNLSKNCTFRNSSPAQEQGPSPLLTLPRSPIAISALTSVPSWHRLEIGVSGVRASRCCARTTRQQQPWHSGRLRRHNGSAHQTNSRKTPTAFRVNYSAHCRRIRARLLAAAQRSAGAHRGRMRARGQRARGQTARRGAQ